MQQQQPPQQPQQTTVTSTKIQFAEYVEVHLIAFECASLWIYMKGAAFQTLILDYRYVYIYDFNNIQLYLLGTIGNASWPHNAMSDATSRPCRSAAQFFTPRHSSGKQCSTVTNTDYTPAIDWLSITNSTFKVSINQIASSFSLFFVLSFSFIRSFT